MSFRPVFGPVSLSVLIAVLLLAVPVRAEIEGKPDILDGDTLTIAGEIIRLHGIDAPEAEQTCTRGGLEYGCGFEATNALAFMTSYQWVKCREVGRDPQGLMVAQCFLGGRYDIGERMVRAGHALPRPDTGQAYEPAKNAAKAAGEGLWSSEFLPPWQWRQQAPGR